MKLNFFPRTTNFNELFLQQNAKVRDAAQLLHEILADYTHVADKAKRIHALEAEGNAVARDISTRLSLTFITAIDREDIHNLNRAQADMLRLLKATAARIGLYDFAQIAPAAVELADNLSVMAGLTGEMLARFVAKKGVADEARRVEDLDGDSDRLLMVALGELYEREVSTPAAILDIVKWSHVYDRIEEAIAQACLLASTIEGISLKYA